MAGYYLASRKNPGISAFISISGGDGIKGLEKMDSLKNFVQIKNIPILDIYGSEDSKPVLKASQERIKAAAKTLKKLYTSKKIDGANHFYSSKQEQLLKTIDEWLNRIQK